MARLPRDRIVEALLERHGQTYGAELGIDLERNTSSALYRWLCGADIFCREAQIAWDELFPFADQRALEAAGRLGLEVDPEKLAACVARTSRACSLRGCARVLPMTWIACWRQRAAACLSRPWKA